MSGDLRMLSKRERQLLNTLDVVEEFLGRYDETKDACQLKIRQQSLNKVYDEFYKVRAKMELIIEDTATKELTDKDSESKQEAETLREAKNYQAMREFEDRYCSLNGKILELQARRDAQEKSGDLQPGGQPATISRVKLPEILLPSFSGNIQEWVTFRDTFRSLIHSNAQLTEIDKFSYLRSSLSGGALQEVASVELTAANYQVAWQALEKRYENKKLIVKAHLDAIFAVESLKRESYEGLNFLIGEFDKNLQMLEKIGEKTANWSTMLAYMICARLDSTTLRLWETHHNSKEVPTYNNIVDFLRNHCSVLQSVAPAKTSLAEQRQSHQQSSVCHAMAKVARKCPVCRMTWHPIYFCRRFQGMQVPERIEFVMRSQLCRNCLQPGHIAQNCGKGVCKHCQQNHHTLLHTNQDRSSVPQPQTRPPTPTPSPNSSTIVLPRQPQFLQHDPNQHTHTQTDNTPTNSHSTNTQFSVDHSSTSHNYVALPTTPTHNILLSTALIRVTDRCGNSMLARALLDSCSQHCFMSRDFSNKLKFRQSPVHLAVQGIGSSRSVSTRLITADVRPRLGSISPFAEDIPFYVLPKLTVSLPTASFSPSKWNLPEAAILADPRFFEAGPIDVIIGAEYYIDLLTDGRVKVADDGATLQNTVLGWIVSGRISSSITKETSSVAHVSCTADIQEQLTRFWELETCRTQCTYSVEETACEEIFKKTTVRDKKGRFVVTLPKRDYVVNQLGESREIALKRFIGLEKRLAFHPELKAMYMEFINEYRALGHMKEVAEESSINKVYYLPHHCVLKPDSTTTKLRVVFDASCRTSSGVSLNDALMVGPVLQDDLLDIILRFRLHRFAIVADIAKMYRMVRVQESDQHLQRIVWRDTCEEPIRTYELTTVTYGTASAPYLATKCLQTLAEEGEYTHPVAAVVLKKGFYVDDMLDGVDNPEDGKILVDEMVNLMESAGFTLRKWNSNSREILLNVPEHLRDDRTVLQLESSSSTVKTLGLLWEPDSDNFRFNSPTWDNSSAITKRSVLSDASRLFDPLGLVGPVIIQAKIYIQDLWKLECGWDDPLSTELQEQWKEYRRNLTGLDSLSVSRWVGITKTSVTELHGFCDASEKAYGACIFVRSISAEGIITIHLLTSKSRVAPLDNLKRKKKRQTIPRLELSAALLLAHLYEKVACSTRLDTRPYFWTDSTIVECWLASPPSRWKEFVANRVSEIQHITKDGVWNHVSSLENPADIISRGMNAAQLQYQSLWFRGPPWLLSDKENWPQPQHYVEEEFDPATLEEKNAVTAVLQAIHPSDYFSLRSSLPELVRLTAYIRRFCFNAKSCNQNNRKLGFITSTEYEEALLALVRLSQKECFGQEYVDLTNGRQVQNSSRIASLNPQLINGVLCVGGRLKNAEVSSSRKHPFIIDHHHPLATSIVCYQHRKLFHAGQQVLISAVREQFWPTNVRNLARKVIHDCVACFRSKPRIQDQLMADLPPERVTPCTPFQRVGVDYCGPFMVVYPYRRCRPVKTFVAVFVCLVTKAVHLELAADLTTNAFLAALKRFSSRRGNPQLIMCDNATNFVGARRALDDLRQLFGAQQFQEEVVRHASIEQIEFRFIPARSPNFGGLWESAVKSFKTLLKRTIGLRSMVYDEMQTMLVQIEAVLNSRPLTPISNDPADYEALTPGHFLIHRPLTAIPEPDLNNVPENRLSAWQRVQHFVQILWKKWTAQYLSDLHNRTKWTRQKDNVAVGTMVILKNENFPPLKWPLARVTEVHAGSDGNIRVVTVRTKDGSFKRAISKICVLPIRDNFSATTE